jgi:alpha-glucosidase
VFGELAADLQDGVPGSTLELYRQLLRLRKDLGLGQGTLQWLTDGQDVATVDLLELRNGPVHVITNLGSDPVPLPAGAEILLVSDELTTTAEGGAAVPTDTTVWLRA